MDTAQRWKSERRRMIIASSDERQRERVRRRSERKREREGGEKVRVTVSCGHVPLHKCSKYKTKKQKRESERETHPIKTLRSTQ